MVPLLFSPITVGPFELPNRMTVAPMCEYSANDGSASAWHTHQLMNNTMSGAELVMVEATAVERLGRLSHGCLGLYTYSNEAALAHLMADATKCRGAGPALPHRPWLSGAAGRGGEEGRGTADAHRGAYCRAGIRRGNPAKRASGNDRPGAGTLGQSSLDLARGRPPEREIHLYAAIRAYQPGHVEGRAPSPSPGLPNRGGLIRPAKHNPGLFRCSCW